jgi:hypothetical protein
MGRCVRIKPALIGSHLGWSTIAMPSEEPSVVVASGERDECGPQLFDGIAGSHPQQILFQGSDEALSRTKEGEASIPRHSTRQSLILTPLDWAIVAKRHRLGNQSLLRCKRTCSYDQ